MFTTQQLLVQIAGMFGIRYLLNISTRQISAWLLKVNITVVHPGCTFIMRVSRHCINIWNSKLSTFIVRVAVLTMQLVVSHSHIRSLGSVAQLYVTDAALETPQVVVQPQTFNNHGCPATWNILKDISVKHWQLVCFALPATHLVPRCSGSRVSCRWLRGPSLPHFRRTQGSGDHGYCVAEPGDPVFVRPYWNIGK